MNTLNNTLEQYPANLAAVLRPVEKRAITGGEGAASHEIVMHDRYGVPRRLSTVSERYALVQNADIVRPFIDTFGIKALAGVMVYGGQRKYQFTFKTGRVFNFGSEERPDIIEERLLIRNSYDKTAAYSFMAGAFRRVCLNGLYSGAAIIAYKKIHTGEIPLNSMIEGVLNNYQNNTFDLWRDFAARPVTAAEAEELARNFKAYAEEEKRGEEMRQNWNNQHLNGIISRRAAAYINAPETVDNARNLWGVYNQINRAINTALPKGALDKKINGNKAAEKYLAAVIGR